MPSRVQAFLLAACCSMAGLSQAVPRQDDLLDHLVGNWVLAGRIHGQATTHDVVAEWILGHRYLQVHETSREKGAQGQPQYEATVLLGWDEARKQYQCLWLDTTGGGALTARSIGLGTRSGNAIPFAWKDADGSVSLINTFTYDPTAHAWTWNLDNVDHGKATVFARLSLTSARP